MICLIALFVFGVLGIFSARYRSLAKEAFNCVFRRVTLRPCDTGFDQKMKMKIVSKTLHKSPKLSKFIYRHFEALSWLFTVLLIVSLVITTSSLYNLVVYGSCDPHSDSCIFAPGVGVTCGSEHCDIEGCKCDEIGCSEENNFSACKGDCDCVREVCGG
jgi:hypothetical protein